MTVDNVAPTVDPDRPTASVNEGTATPTASRPSPTRARTPSLDDDRLRHRRRPGRAGHVQRRAPVRAASTAPSPTARPARPSASRSATRRRRLRQRHRRRDGRQRRPDGDPDRSRPRSTRARPHTYSFTVTDPGTDTRHGDIVRLAATRRAGHVHAATGAGSFDCTFPDGPASPTVSVDGRATPTAPRTADTTRRDGRQRRPDGDPDGGNARSTRARRHTYSFTGHRPGRRTRSRCVDQLRRRRQPGRGRPSTRPPARAASTAPSPTARPRPSA